MAQSLSRVLIHFVFATKHREQFLRDDLRPDLHAFIGGIVRKRNGVLIAAGGIEDHMHLLARVPATITLADLIRDVKTNSSAWMHDQGSIQFAWQGGYGAFSVSPVLLDEAVAYIQNQHEHHRTVTFQEEYLAFLRKYEVEYDERFLWD